MLACDISVNNVLAIANSKLIGKYVSIDDRLRQLGVCAKGWASKRGINDRSRGTLSSFSLVLMLINHMQGMGMLPSIQDLAIARNYAPIYVTGIDCRYATEQEEIQEELEYLRDRHKDVLRQRHNVNHPDELNIGYLLYDFFRHYAVEYKQGVITVRNTQSFACSREAGSTYLNVDNPFELGKDVANVEPSMHPRIKAEIKRMHSEIIHGRSFEELIRGPNE